VGPQQPRWIRDATAVAAYHAQDTDPIVQLLLCDDPPQFGGITDALALCWIHEGRHCKKLTPWVKARQEKLAAFLTRFWAYYRELQTYRVQPSRAERDRLAARFDEVFTPNLDYRSLDERIAKTRDNKAQLLQVLEHPEIPLHNNPAELGARGRVRKRDGEFRTAQRGGSASVGYLRNAGGDDPETGAELLRRHPGSGRRDQPDPASGPDHSSAGAEPQPGDVLDRIITRPGLLKRYPLRHRNDIVGLCLCAGTHHLLDLAADPAKITP